MDHNTTTQHVERAEQDVPSSAGLDTQRLAPADSPAPTTGASMTVARAGQHNRIGIALVVIGLALWLTGAAPDAVAISWGLSLMTIGGGFLVSSFWSRLYGLLIPGCILVGLGVGIPFAELTSGISIVWGLALGFLAIYFAGRTVFNKQSPWPIFPAIPLFCVGIIIAVASLAPFLAGGMVWLPLLLIGAGLYLGWGRRRTV